MNSTGKSNNPPTTLSLRYEKMHKAVDEAVRSLEALYASPKDFLGRFTDDESSKDPNRMTRFIDRVGYGAILRTLCPLELCLKQKFDKDIAFLKRLAATDDYCLQSLWGNFNSAWDSMGILSSLQKTPRSKRN